MSLCSCVPGFLIRMLFHFAQNVIEVYHAASSRALFERKLFDGSLDFRKAHVGDLTIAQLLFQVPVIQSERLSIGSSDPISPSASIFWILNASGALHHVQFLRVYAKTKHCFTELSSRCSGCANLLV